MANSIFAGGFFTTSNVSLVVSSPYTSLKASHAIQATDTTGEILTGNDGFFYWLNRSVFTSPADAQINLTNNAVTIGVGLDVGTDAILKVRTRAQNAYATVDALGYKVGGTAGVATFGPSAVASITVAGGIITAIS